MYQIYCKVGNVELSEKDAFEIYENQKYIVTSTAVYQPHYSQAQQKIYFTKILEVKGIAKRGRFYTMTAKEINNILNKEILVTL